MRRRFGTGRWVAAAALGCVAALASGAVGIHPVGAFARFDESSTFTTSTKHVTTTNRVDLADAPALGCDDPGSPAVLVEETSTELDLVAASTLTVGPADIFVGEDQLTPFHVKAGSINVDTLTTYETVVTQYFQATAPGPPCAAVLAARFTG